MKCSLGSFNFLKEISSLSHPIVSSLSMHCSFMKGICYDQCILLANTLLAFVLRHFVLQGQTYLLLLNFLLLHSRPL